MNIKKKTILKDNYYNQCSLRLSVKTEAIDYELI